MCLPLRRLRILDWLRKTRTVVITDEVRQTGIIDHAPVYPREAAQLVTAISVIHPSNQAPIANQIAT